METFQRKTIHMTNKNISSGHGNAEKSLQWNTILYILCDKTKINDRQKYRFCKNPGAYFIWDSLSKKKR